MYTNTLVVVDRPWSAHGILACMGLRLVTHDNVSWLPFSLFPYRSKTEHSEHLMNTYLCAVYENLSRFAGHGTFVNDMPWGRKISDIHIDGLHTSRHPIPNPAPIVDIPYSRTNQLACQLAAQTETSMRQQG